MKKMLFVFSSVLMLSLLAACGEKKADPTPQVDNSKKAPKIDIYVLRKEPDPAPSWVYDEDWMVAKDADGTKKIYFKAAKQRPTLEKAMYDVKMEKAVLLAGIIKQLTSVEMVRATEGMLNDTGELDTYFSETAAAISRNVDTGGVMNSGTYWEYVQEVEGETSTKYYRAVLRYSMDYTEFKNKLMGAVKKEAPRINQDLKLKGDDLVNKMNSQLDALGQ